MVCTDKGYEDMGLTGKTIRIRPKVLMDEDMLSNPRATDTWQCGECRAHVEYESPYFIVLTILPHFAPICYGESKLYPTTIHKHDIMTGEMILKTLDGEPIKVGRVKYEQTDRKRDGHHWYRIGDE